MTLQSINQLDIILASEAEWRSDVLKQLGINHRCINHRYREPKFKVGDLAGFVKEIAEYKAKSLTQDFPDAMIIAADQLIATGQDVLYKSGSKEKAKEQLNQLNGKPHNLICAVAVLYRDKIRSEVDQATLTMRQLSQVEIDYYVDIEQPWSCAGSYKIESLGASLFSSISVNDPTTIIGIPSIKLLNIIRSFGFSNLLA